MGCAQAFAAARSTQQSACRGSGAVGVGWGKKSRSFLAPPRQMVSGLWSGFRHLCHKPDVNAKPCASGIFRSFHQRNPFDEACSNPALWPATFGLTRSQPMGRLLLHASRRRYSNPQLSKLFRNAPPNATFPQTDHSLDGMQRRMRALASLTNQLKACGHIDDVLGLFQAD